MTSTAIVPLRKFELTYERMCTALAEARSIGVVKDLADKAEALRVYARQAKNRQAEIDAAEIRIRAERRVGELLAEARERGTRHLGGRRKTSPQTGLVSGPLPTLSDLGMDRRFSAKCQAIAMIPGKAFDQRIATWRKGAERDNERVTLTILRGETKAERRTVREAELATRVKALPDRRYGVVLADPEWRFEVRSRVTGLDRSADNHYPTSSLEEIARRPVASIAAPDCALFLWATMPHLAAAIAIMAGWGFTYRSHLVWRKAEIDKKVVLGTGYWFRGAHELLLLGTCGSVPAPAPGTQWPSVVDHPPLRHSEKPAIFHALIEQYFPTVPKIELNARAARPGWDAWGLEAPAAEGEP